MSDLLRLPRFRYDKPGSFTLADLPTDLGDDLEKKALKAALEKDVARITELQERLYAEGSRSLLLIFQALDAAGKDSCIQHVMTGVNPQGCHVWSFKSPTSEELAHDFLWRHAKALPARGMIGIHNRSHYEEVLVVRVHPEYLAAQRLPDADGAKDPGKAFWEARYASIRTFEEHLARQGTVLMKFYLHMGRAKQRERFLERLDEPSKQWKFSLGDVKERAHWDAYQRVYEQAIGATAAPHAPWFVVPADDQWESRAIVGRLVREQLEAMEPQAPRLSERARKELAEGRALLEAED